MEKKQNISRRDFIINSTIMSAAAFSIPGTRVAKVRKYKMGLQLFTIRDAMAKDVPGTLKIVSSLGYQDTEIYGYNGEQGTYYGLKAADFKKLLEDNGLTATSGHYDFAALFDKPEDELKRYVDQCIQGAQAIGSRYITWPWLDPESRTIEKFKVLTGKLNLIGDQVNKSGLGFAYHNHNFEFIDHNGENGYDIVMRETDPKLVKLQIDLYWVAHSSKLTAIELFNKQPGRFVMWHIKDMDKVSRDYTEMGNGSIDYKPILPYAEKSGLQYYFIEQGGNFAKNSIQSITDSAAYFKKNLEKYLG
ncbi:MAG: sugar phosphate isomerase/epimerase [Chryseolinea sp.]